MLPATNSSEKLITPFAKFASPILDFCLNHRDARFLTVIVIPIDLEVEHSAGCLAIQNCLKKAKWADVVFAHDESADSLNCAAFEAKSDNILFFSSQSIMNCDCLFHHAIEQLRSPACVIGEQKYTQLSSLTPLGRTYPGCVSYHSIDPPLRFDPRLSWIMENRLAVAPDAEARAINDRVKNMSIPRKAFLNCGGFDPSLEELYGLDFINKLHREKLPIRDVRLTSCETQFIPIREMHVRRSFKKEIARIACRNEI